MIIRNKAVVEYKEKRDLMFKAIRDYLPNLRHTKPIVGMFILLWLLEHINGIVFAEKALEKYAVVIISATLFFTDNSGKT